MAAAGDSRDFFYSLSIYSRWDMLRRGVWLPHLFDVGVRTSLTLPTVLPRAYCTTVGGVEGCCKVGHTCTRLLDECAGEGQQRCPDENFCCGERAFKFSLPFPHNADGALTQTQAAGETCYRDADGSPRCSSSSSKLVSGGISVVPALFFLFLWSFFTCGVLL